MKKLLYKCYPAIINVYTVWILYLLYFASFRFSQTVIFTIKSIPFETIDEYTTNVINYNKTEFVKNIFGNILLFIPYGFLGIMYPKLNQLKWFLFAFFIVINIVEFSQYYFKRGFADIDDIILNTIGAIIGFCIYKRFFFIKDK